MAVRVDHIGSTAVPGLAAKDVIDVQIGVADLDDPRLEPALAQLGATRTEVTTDHQPPGDLHGPRAWEKRYFRPPASWRPTHLHVRETGRPNFRYALLFRDYLRHSAAAAGAYAQIKVALARAHPTDVEAYYSVKDPVCDLVMDAASAGPASGLGAGGRCRARLRWRRRPSGGKPGPTRPGGRAPVRSRRLVTDPEMDEGPSQV